MDKNDFIRIGYQGDIGSNNERATILFIKKLKLNNVKMIPLITSKNVVENLMKKEIDFGVMAIKNSIGGEVIETVESIANLKYDILLTERLKIQHCLCALSLDSEIHSITSHVQALKQISFFLKEKYPNIKIFPYSDTAKAGIDLKSGLLDKNTAVIASKETALNNNLFILNENISNDIDNFTDFILINLKT
jgi:prephenate dehydratase